jgi:LysM repeat protein
MKWRDWQLLIILALLGYIALNLAFLFPSWIQPDDQSPEPSPTARGTVASPAIRVVAPTSTLRPSSTPMPTTSLGPATTVPPTEASTPMPPAEVQPTANAMPSVEPPPTATPTRQTQIHVVQKGENLLRIAERYGVTMQSIVEQNHLADPDVIYIGQSLVIPWPVPLSPSPTPPG